MTDSTSAVPPWTRVGRTAEWCQHEIQRVQRGLEWWGRWIDVYGWSRENPTFESCDGRQHDLFICFQQIQLAHLGVDHPFGDYHKIVETGSKLAVDLFCGSWRDNAMLHSGKTMDRAQCRSDVHDNWLDDYRLGLLFALLNRDQRDAEQVAGYFGEDLPEDNGLWDRVANDRLLHGLIGGFLCGREWDQAAAETIEKGRPKRPKFMLTLLRAIGANDVAAFRVSFPDLVKNFIKREAAMVEYPNAQVAICIDASVMCNLAQHKGLEVGTFGDDIADFVVTNESLARRARHSE